MQRTLREKNNVRILYIALSPSERNPAHRVAYPCDLGKDYSAEYWGSKGGQDGETIGPALSLCLLRRDSHPALLDSFLPSRSCIQRPCVQCRLVPEAAINRGLGHSLLSHHIQPILLSFEVSPHLTIRLQTAL